MKATEAVRSIMKEQGVGLSKLSDRMEMEPRRVSDRLRQENISIDKLNEMLRALDYKIFIAPRETRRPVGSFEIE